MNPYVMDISSSRIQNAMLNLGIEPKELIRKVFEDFATKNSKEEIQIVRYNFFKRKQEELVRQIKDYIKTEIIRGFEINSSSKNQESSNNDFLITSLQYPESKLCLKPKARPVDIISKALSEVKEAISERETIDKKLQHSKEVREKARSAISKIRLKFSEFKERQKENLERIKYNEQKNIAKLLRCSTSASPNKLIIKQKFTRFSQSQTRNSSHKDLDIETQIKQYEQKMVKSKNLHDLSNLNKKKAISKLLERGFKIPKVKDLEEKELNEKLTQLVFKSKTLENRKFENLRQKEQIRYKIKEKNEEKMSRAQSRIKERAFCESVKARSLEKKLQVSNSLLEKKHFNWKREIEVRNEMQRLKDEEMLNNAERKKRIM